LRQDIVSKSFIRRRIGHAKGVGNHRHLLRLKLGYNSIKGIFLYISQCQIHACLRSELGQF
jgi:hypothetical protein